MAWKFDNNIPIYIQISNIIKLQIVTKQLKSGDKLPTVRDLAETAGVNPNTVQRALSDLETEGFYRCNDANDIAGSCADFIFHKCNN